MSLNDLLEKHLNELEKLNNQRRMWLWASSVVLCGIVFLIFGWDWLSGTHHKSIWWVVVSLMLLISVNWWYWTMKVVRIIIQYQEIEYVLIKDIYNEIHNVKDDIKESFEEIMRS